MNKESKVYIAGHRGMVGSALKRNLESKGINNIVFRKSSELDLRNQASVLKFFEDEKPEYVFLAAAKVGGISANNTFRGSFIYDNLMIQNNIIHSSYLNDVKKLLFLGSSCIYPKLSPQPIKEEYLLDGKLEPTNQPYALAKIAGIEMCNSYRSQYNCNYITAMPTNLYGPNDNYDLENSHVLPALIRKIHIAKKQNLPEVVMWGTGSPKREFLHVDDLAEACVFLMHNYKGNIPINVGTGEDISIIDLARLIKEIIGYQGKITKDLSKPDGTPRKLLNVDHLNNIGWKANIQLEEGIRSVYAGLTKKDWGK
ncbi:GDP-L-fucose synthase [Saprospiraceae bacterium]|nr:GDP-L-fucose synthase [Saprospiraceae bacterium]